MTEIIECIQHKFEEAEDYRKIQHSLTSQVFHCIFLKTVRSEIAKARSCAQLLQIVSSELQQLGIGDLIKFLELTEKYLWPNQINQLILKLETVGNEPTTKLPQNDVYDFSKDSKKTSRPSEELTKIRDEESELVLCVKEKAELIVSKFSVPKFEEGGMVTGVGDN